MIPFNDIAHALSMPPGTGKTYNMIKSAPVNSVVLASNEQMAEYLRREVRQQGRTDLEVHVPRDGSMRGLNGRKLPFVADHGALTAWLLEADRAAGSARELRQQLLKAEAELKLLRSGTQTPRPIDEYHEDMGDVLWWKFPLDEAPYCGNPNDCGMTVELRHYVMKEVSPGNWERDIKTVRSDVGGWPGYHTHWTPLPKVIAP